MNSLLKTLTLFFFISLPIGVQALDVPTLRNRVTDLAQVLDQSTANALESELRSFEQQSSNQVAVLIIPSLEDDNLESYSHRVAETWHLGTADKDNGVLLLIVVNDRKLRIEVGYGLENTLTDALSAHIIQNEIVPHFKSGNYNEGIRNGVSKIIGSLQNTYQPDLNNYTSDGEPIPVFAKFFMFMIWFLVVGTHSTSALLNKSIAGSIFHFIFLLPFWLVFPMVIVGPVLGGLVFVIFLIGFPLLSIFLRSTPGGRNMMAALGKKRSSSNNFWYSGMGTGFSGSSRSSGSSFSSSSFSGGGGSFGGGGSSGSW